MSIAPPTSTASTAPTTSTAPAAAPARIHISSLSFLTPGNFPDDDPYAGLEQTLRLFELGERLGLDGAWIRQRHLEHGVGSAAVFLAAAAQRTRRVELGTAVIPIGYESPFRLAEDLSMADVLSGGRLQVGLSAGVPPHAELIGHLVFDGDWRTYDLSYGRISRPLENLRGDFLGDQDTVIHSPGARPRRVALGRVIVPLDGADRATRRKYRDYAASRHERTGTALRVPQRRLRTDPARHRALDRRRVGVGRWL